MIDKNGTVVIIGAGALGKSLAALLSDHTEIIVYERSPSTIKRRVFAVKEKDQEHIVKVRSVHSLKQLQELDIKILIFATKAVDLRNAIEEASVLKPRCIFLPQNGILDVTWVSRVFKNIPICRGVTTMACQEMGTNKALLFYRGEIYAGGEGGHCVSGIFRDKVKVKVFKEYKRPEWAKLVFSSVMNPLPVITGLGYGILKTDKEIWKLVCRAVKEGREIAHAYNIRLGFDPYKLIKRVRDGDLKGIAHRGSITSDVARGRSTELNFITGALIRQGRRKGIRTPALDLIFKRAKAAGA